MAVLDAHRRPGPARSRSTGVVQRIADYVQRRGRARRPDWSTALPATNVYYDYPGGHPAERAGRQRVPPGGGRWRQVLGRPAEEVAGHQRRPGGTDRRDQPRSDPSRRHLCRRAAGGRDPDPDRLAERQRLRRGLRGGAPAAGSAPSAGYVAGLGMQATPQNAGEVLAVHGPGRSLRRPGGPTDGCHHDGWANILARGATFTWEVWHPSDVIGDSMSHGWGSTVVPEIQRSLLGVRPTGPGFATFTVAPPPAGLDWALGTVPTPRGPISVAWRRPTAADPHFSVDVGVPPNSVATLLVASEGPGGITEGGRTRRGIARRPPPRGRRGHRPPRIVRRYLPGAEPGPRVSRNPATARSPTPRRRRAGRSRHGPGGPVRPAVRAGRAGRAAALVGLAALVGVAGPPVRASASPPGPLSTPQLASGAAHACIVGGPRPWTGRDLENPILSDRSGGVKDQADHVGGRAGGTPCSVS